MTIIFMMLAGVLSVALTMKLVKTYMAYGYCDDVTYNEFLTVNGLQDNRENWELYFEKFGY